jgi:hypothetical protein
MFAHTSRYYLLEALVHRAADGREIAYKRRRFLPSGRTLPLLVEAVVGGGDRGRLDLLTARTLGRGELFWRVADANDAVDPFALAVPGRRLRVPLPQV